MSIFSRNIPTKLLRTLIIDDEPHIRETMQGLLKKFCPQVKVVGEAGSVAAGEREIRQKRPDLVLLDIKMGDGTGFDLLNRFENIDFKIIFVTAYEKYAIQAFGFSAVDYLLKPVNPEKLTEAVERTAGTIQSNFNTQLKALKQNIQAPGQGKAARVTGRNRREMSNGVKYLHPAILIVLIVLFNAGFLHAQYYFNLFRPDADTLYEQLQHANERDKIDIYNSLAFYHSFSNADSAIYYAEQALELEKKHPDEIRRADANRHLGNAYALKNMYGRALFHLNQAMNIHEDNRVLRKKAELLFDLGKLNYDLEDYPAALNYLQRFERLYIEENIAGTIIATPLEYAIFIGLGGGIPRESGDYELAKQYFKRYIELSKLHEFPHRINAIMTLSLAQTFEKNQEFDSALHYYYVALPLYHENHDKTHQEYTGYEGAVGYLLFRTGKPLEALLFIKHALQRDTARHEYFLSSVDASRLGNVYLHLGMHDSALYYFQQALYYTVLMHEKDLGVSLDTVKPRVYDGYQNIASLPDLQIRQKYYERKAIAYDNFYRYYLQKNDAAKALEYLQYKLPYLDSVRITTKETDLYRIQARFENERLEQQVVNLSKDNELKESRLQRNQLILGSVGLITFLILALGVLYVRQGRINALHEKLLVEQRLFRSQMNPHFIFNSLASVQNFIIKQDDTRASIYLSRFSELVRSILNNSLQEQITLEEEISTIENYLALQKVRFSDKFDYDIEVDDALDPESTFVPPMLTQPFIENAIEHGIKHKKGKGRIEIRIKRSGEQAIGRSDQTNGRSGDRVILEVEDDGVGREKAQEIFQKQDKDHKSLSTAITRERIAVLNRRRKHKITLDIIDLKDEQGEARGTKVVFRVPV